MGGRRLMIRIVQVRTLVVLNGEEQFGTDQTNSGQQSSHKNFLVSRPTVQGVYGRKKRQTSALNNNGHTAVKKHLFSLYKAETKCILISASVDGCQ